MDRKKKVREALQTRRSARVTVILIGIGIAGTAAIYLYFHNPHQYPLPCLFHIITGLYCPGCGAGRASYSILHGRFYDAFRYNPVYVILIPFLGIYIAARAIDWVLTGGNHVDRKINPKILYVILVLVIGFGVVRNLPLYPFTLLVSGGY